MEILNDVLPIVLYFLGAVLLVVIIILITKLIQTIEKANILLDDIEKKSQKLNGLFDAVESVGDTISSVNFKVLSTVTGIAGKIFKKKKQAKEKKKLEKESSEHE